MSNAIEPITLLQYRAAVRVRDLTEPRVAEQMLDLKPYRPVSRIPPVRCDLSLMVAQDATAEALGDRVRERLGSLAEAVELVAVRCETRYAELPQQAGDRMGALPRQKNVLVHVVLRHPTRTLWRGEVNELRDRIYGAIHRGTRQELIGTS